VNVRAGCSVDLTDACGGEAGGLEDARRVLPDARLARNECTWLNMLTDDDDCGTFMNALDDAGT
jgi:hypothetical protein